jgi:RNA polymerase sigma-70 factor (ECF subfamily)
VTDGRRSETDGPGPGITGRELRRFDEVVLPYLDAAYNLARHLLRNPHDAEDAVQEAFLRAVRYFDGFRGVDGRAWLLRIVRNTCFTQLRRGRTGGEHVEFDEQVHTAEDESTGPEADLVRTMTADLVRERLAGLPAEFREVLVLRELEGMSYKEIAQVAGVPIGTVMSRLSRARRQLVAALGAEGEGSEEGHGMPGRS